MTSTREARVREIAQQYAAATAPAALTSPGALLPALQAVQQELGWIDRPDVLVLADVFNRSVAEVHGVVSFYHDLHTSPPPAHRISLCRGEACQAVGAEALFEHTSIRFADDPGVAVGEVFCLGNCALGPSGLLDGCLRGRLTAHAIETSTGGWSQ